MSRFAYYGLEETGGSSEDRDHLTLKSFYQFGTFFLVTVCYRSALTIQFPTNIDTIQVLYYSKSLCLIYIWLTVYGGFEAWLTPRTKIQHISASAAFI